MTALTCVIGLLAVSAAVSFAVPSEPELEEAREHAQVLERRADEASSELERVEAELEVLETRLTVMQERLDEALATHRAAESAAMEASARTRQAEGELDAALDQLATNEQLLAGLARDALKYGAPSASPTMAAVELLGDGEGELADRLHYLNRGLGARSGAIERAVVLRVEVEALTHRARAEEAELRRLEAEADAKRDEVATLHAELMELVSEQSVKVDRSVQLVAELEREQQATEVRIGQLEEQVEREREEARQRELERQERERREREERERREREGRERREREERERREREQQRSTSNGSSGSAGSVSVSPGPSPDLRTVGGITVAASLAPQLEALLNHARADGIVFGGHGYRSPEVTARLRIANGCPDVYDSPASSCRVPTARPGTSMHEQGLAVDFTYRGQTICFPRPASHCAGNAGFEWLRQHAGSYGLRNLPTEAWHWSTNGR